MNSSESKNIKSYNFEQKRLDVETRVHSHANHYKYLIHKVRL